MFHIVTQINPFLRALALQNKMVLKEGTLLLYHRDNYVTINEWCKPDRVKNTLKLLLSNDADICCVCLDDFVCRPKKRKAYDCPTCHSGICFDCIFQMNTIDFKCPNCRQQVQSELDASKLMENELYFQKEMNISDEGYCLINKEKELVMQELGDNPTYNEILGYVAKKGKKLENAKLPAEK